MNILIIGGASSARNLISDAMVARGVHVVVVDEVTKESPPEVLEIVKETRRARAGSKNPFILCLSAAAIMLEDQADVTEIVSGKEFLLTLKAFSEKMDVPEYREPVFARKVPWRIRQKFGLQSGAPTNIKPRRSVNARPGHNSQRGLC